MTHGADAALHQFGIGDAAESRRHHVAVLEGARQLTALLRIVAQPVQQLGESPLVGIHPAAPFDRFQVLGVGELGNLLRLALGAMVAPQIVVIERLHAASTGTTLEPVVSSAIASTCSPGIPALASTARIALTSASI